MLFIVTGRCNRTKAGSVQVIALAAYAVLVTIAGIVWAFSSYGCKVNGGVELMALDVNRLQHADAAQMVSESESAVQPVREEVSAASAPRSASDQFDVETITFNGRRLRKSGELSMLVTAYSPDSRSCGRFADGITASGYSVWTNGMKLVAADTDLLPFGSIITVPGYNNDNPVPVLDRGGKIKGRRLDVLYPTHEIARQWGAQRLTVVVWEYVDG